MTTNLIMVRHAESPYIFGQERTRGLSSDGEQAAKKVAELLLLEEVDVMVSSPYARAIKTIEEIATTRIIKIELFEELKERLINGNNKIPWEEVKPAIEKSFTDKNYCLPGGETTEQAQKRAIPVVMQLLEEHKGKNIVVGTHGNIMTIIMNYFDDQYGYDFWASTSMPDIYKLGFRDGDLIEVKRIWKQNGAI